jgi:hypothetical protein
LLQPFTWDVGAGLPLLLQDRLASYLYSPGGQILEQIAGSTATYYHADQLGSVRAGQNSAARAQRPLPGCHRCARRLSRPLARMTLSG